MSSNNPYNLTEDEQIKVNEHSKNLEDRPTYYNADTKKKVIIGDDFEAFLILATKEFKNNAIKWINKSLNDNPDFSKRDAIVREAINKDLTYINNILENLENYVSEFINMKESMRNLKKTDAKEIGIMLEDLHAGMEDTVTYYNKYKHLQNYITLLESTVNNIINMDKLSEKKSWIDPLSSY